MIIRVTGAGPDKVDAARQSLGDMVDGWGHLLTTVATDTPSSRGVGHDGGKVVDPISVAALILSVPSAALAVSDLADRIGKRRRAKQLIDHARELAAGQVTLEVVAGSSSRDLAALDTDQLLDLLAEEGDDPA